jgi:mono/diheme cytochrome c family protein
MAHPSKIRLATLVAAGLSLVTAPALAQQPDPRLGRALAQQNCGACHAVGRTGRSPYAAAPPFRELKQRRPGINIIDIVLLAWSRPHREMPDFSFDTANSREILAHIESLQIPPRR